MVLMCKALYNLRGGGNLESKVESYICVIMYTKNRVFQIHFYKTYEVAYYAVLKIALTFHIESCKNFLNL